MQDVSQLLESVKGLAPLDVVFTIGRELAIPIIGTIIFPIVIMMMLWVLFKFRDEGFITLFILMTITIILMPLVFALLWIYLT